MIKTYNSRAFILWGGFILLVPSMIMILGSVTRRVARYGVVDDGLAAIFVPGGLFAMCSVVMLIYWRKQPQWQWPSWKWALLAVALAAASPLVGSLVYAVNVLADAAPPEVHDVTVIHVYAGDRYTRLVAVSHWEERPNSANNCFSLRLPEEIYRRTGVGYKLRLVTHPGSLGFEWVSDVSIPDPYRPVRESGLGK